MTKNYTIKDITDKVKKNKRWADIKLIQVINSSYRTYQTREQ